MMASLRRPYSWGVDGGSRTTGHCNYGNLQLGTRTSRIERLITASLREHAIDPSLVPHESLVCLVLVHGVFADHDVHPFLYLNHEGVSTLIFVKFNPELRERHLLSGPVDLQVYDLSGRPTTRNRPNPGGHELFNDIATAKYGTGKMKCTFAVPNPQGPLIEFSRVHRCQGRNRARQRMSRACIAGDFRHVDLQIEPMRVPVVGEVGLAARSNLNSGDPLSGVLAPGVEGAARVLSVIELPVAALDNFGDNYQFVESSEGIDTGVAAEGLHDPNEFRHLKERSRRKLVDFHRKGFQNSRQNRVAGEPEPTDKEVAKDNKFSVPRGRDLLVKRGSPSARREEPGSLILPNHVGCHLGLSEDK
jgi:hypothetical protein